MSLAIRKCIEVAPKIFFKKSKIKTWVSRPVFQKLSKPTDFQNLWGKFQIEVSQEDNRR
jgi:hypothetical protein